ncbi:MAG: hypothetical protein DRO96_01580 [Candidatus Aenigmatarchaeota archaeon]|nr:MAG: hypothetical protein DRO96_01580 [Candidatus Aenigmarchaeota archaeon]
MITLENELQNNLFVQEVIQDEISGFNVFSSYPYHPESLNILYGHADLNHLRIVLEELEKDTVVPWRILQRHSIYRWNDSWTPSVNTKIAEFSEKQVAIENGYLINFLPSKKDVSQLIEFLTSRCWARETDCLKASWDCPYITTDFEFPGFTLSKEIILRTKQGLTTSCYLPDRFANYFGIEQKCFLFEPFAQFIDMTQQDRSDYEFSAS